MGLGLYCRAQLRQERWGEDSALLKIEKIAEQRAQAFGLRALFSSAIAENRLNLILHPGAESIEFAVLESGMIECSAKTSSVGPGYHSHIIDLLDAISDKTGLSWNLDEDEADETGFARHRDFAELRRAFTEFLCALSNVVVEHDRKGVTGLMLNMPTGFVPRLCFGVGTPLGEWPIEHLAKAADPDRDIEQIASQFFPWWDQSLNAQAWLNLGLIDLWMTIPWRPPVDDGEREQFERALSSFAMARSLKSDLPLLREIDELNDLLNSDSDQIVVPSTEGIGYHRRLLRESLAGGWSVEIPGYFYGRLEDDQSTKVFWYGDREVWFTSFSIEPARAATLSDVREDSQETSRFVDHFGIVGRQDIAQKDGHFTMSCVFQGTGTSAIATIIYVDPDDAGWAQQTFESIRHNHR